MAEESKSGDASGASDEEAEKQPLPSRVQTGPRVDDKGASPGFVSTDAGCLPRPAESRSSTSTTPKSQAALTGKAPSGSSTSGTTVPAATAGKFDQPKEDVGLQPPGGASPNVGKPKGQPSQADAEKASVIAEAKARVSAAKQAAGDKPSPSQPTTTSGAPKPPVKKKEEGPKPTDASHHPLVKKLREQFSGAITEASEFMGQLSVGVEASRIVEVCGQLKTNGETPFNYLSDLTCVHFPDRAGEPFEIVYNLYSIPANVRVRLKVRVNEDQGVESVTSIWPAANWMEREVFDLFGVPFQGHPDLRRILLPEDWEGHPLRKEYPLEFVENAWTVKHLPEFTDVQKEQLLQRRGYGLEILSNPAERRVREIFRGDKEVMPKDK